MFRLFQKYTYYFLLTNDGYHFLPLKTWPTRIEIKTNTLHEIHQYVKKITRVFKALKCTTRVAYNRHFQFVGNKIRTEYIER